MCMSSIALTNLKLVNHEVLVDGFSKPTMSASGLRGTMGHVFSSLMYGEDK